MPERMHRVPVLFPQDLYRRLAELAHEQRRSISSLVREAVRAELAACGKQSADAHTPGSMDASGD